MKILIAIPCLYNADCCVQSINSVLNRHGIDILLLDNGADQDVKDKLEKFKEYSNVTVLHEPKNIYVNPAWQKFIDYFLDHPEYDHLIIMNSDLIMNHDFHHVLKNIWKTYPEFSLVPKSVDREKLLEKVNYDLFNVQYIHKGIAGVFITLSRQQAKLISPIPNEILIWYGDNWIYEILHKSQYIIGIPDNLLSHHVGSETVKRLPELQQILDQDKINWETIVKPQIENKINNV